MATDPWDDPIEEIKRVRDAELRRNEELSANRSEYDNFQLLWSKANSLRSPPETFMALGAELSKRRYDFWIELMLLTVRREHEARKLDRPSHRAVRERAVGQLILAACRGEEIGELLTRMRSHVYDTTFSAAIEAMRVTISTWIGTKQYPATPHMTRQELVTACKKIHGMSAPSISRAIQKGRITTGDQIDEFVRFSHADPEIQLQILSACLKFLSPDKKS